MAGRPTVDYEHFVVAAARVVEFIGVAVLLLGALVAALAFARRLVHRVGFDDAYHGLRADLGRAILLELEVSGRWPWQRGQSARQDT